VGDRLKDNVALVSGAGSSGPGWGNGKATAVLFAREGATVLAADITPDAALETKRIIEAEGGICEAFAGDVSRADDVAAMVDTCIAAFRRIDVLHNNVGIVEVGGPVETSEESWDRVNDVNLKSMFLTCNQVLPHMVRQGNGTIVNVASVFSHGVARSFPIGTWDVGRNVRKNLCQEVVVPRPRELDQIEAVPEWIGHIRLDQAPDAMRHPPADG
jgi:NAD(P)-dependent dehydrogenase (short-subunit alcohol dehydrogenase family)